MGLAQWGLNLSPLLSPLILFFFILLAQADAMTFLLIFLILLVQVATMGASFSLLGTFILFLMGAMVVFLLFFLGVSFPRMASIPDPCGCWELVAHLCAGHSLAIPFIPVALWSVAGSLVAKLGRAVLIFLLGDLVAVMARDFCFIFIWEVPLLSAPVAFWLVACSMVAELDHDPLLLIFKAVVSVSGNLAPVFRGHNLILFLAFLVFVASVSVAGLVMEAFIGDVILFLPGDSMPGGQVSVLSGDIIIIIIFFFFAPVARDRIVIFI